MKHASDRFRSPERVSLFDWRCAERLAIVRLESGIYLRRLFVALTHTIDDSQRA